MGAFSDAATSLAETLKGSASDALKLSFSYCTISAMDFDVDNKTCSVVVDGSTDAISGVRMARGCIGANVGDRGILIRLGYVALLIAAIASNDHVHMNGEDYELQDGASIESYSAKSVKCGTYVVTTAAAGNEFVILTPNQQTAAFGRTFDASSDYFGVMNGDYVTSFEAMSDYRSNGNLVAHLDTVLEAGSVLRINWMYVAGR